MNTKKNSRYDLERKRIVLFQVGLLTAGSFTLAAFNYSTPMKTKMEKAQVHATPIDWMTEIPEIKKPIEPKIKPEVQAPKNDATSPQFENKTISEDVSAKNNSEELPNINISIPDFKGAEIDVEIIDVTGEYIEPFPLIDAAYIGGIVEMKKEIKTKLHYPEIDIHTRTQGVVYVSFVVEKNGDVSNVNIERGISNTIDREAKRIVEGFPKWKPAENTHGKVRSIIRLPIRFILE